MAFHRLEKNKLWLIKAIDRYTGRPIAWVLGSRDTKTFRRLYEKVKHCRYCVFFTDAWDAFAKVLPPERHIIGKEHTISIEQDNSNTRHHLARFTRRTKVVSKSDTMVDLSIRLWVAVTDPDSDIFDNLQKIALSIF